MSVFAAIKPQNVECRMMNFEVQERSQGVRDVLSQLPYHEWAFIRFKKIK